MGYPQGFPHHGLDGAAPPFNPEGQCPALPSMPSPSAGATHPAACQAACPAAPATQAGSNVMPAELEELRGRVSQLSRTQPGSKYLQRMLTRGHPGVVEQILQEVEQDIAQLMCDAYGNYLCSTAFQQCWAAQRKRMLERMAPSVAAIARDKRGTHALQALIGQLATLQEQEVLMQAVRNHVIDLSMDSNGTHVVQRLLLTFKPQLTDWIYGPIVNNLVEVAHHPYGLCVLKKCISQAQAQGRHHDQLLNQLAVHALDLVQSPYGNYAIQHALEVWGGPRCVSIFDSLEGTIMQLSIQKFSSNVVEKILDAAPLHKRRRFIDELIESDKMSVLVNSNYGHYVVKRALQLAEPPQARRLLDVIRSQLAQLPNKRLRVKWEKVIGASLDAPGSGAAHTVAGAE